MIRYTALYFLAGMFMTLGLLTGCKQDVDVFIPREGPDPNAVGDIGRFFQKAAQDLQSQVYVTSNDQNTLIQTSKGTQIHCPAGLFVNQNGVVVNGDVELEVLEIFTKSEMIRLNRFPVSSDKKVLDSGGELFLRATQGGEELQLAGDKKMRIETTAPDAVSEMELFYGVNLNDPLAPDNDFFAWEEADGDPNIWNNVNAWEWFDSLGNDWKFGYVFETTQLGWLNIDRFLKEPGLELTQVCLELPDAYDPTNSLALIVFDDLNSVMPLWGDPDQQKFCQINIPVNYSVKLVLISEQGDDNYFYAETPVVVQPDMTVSLLPVSTGFESVLNAIENL